MEIANEMSTGGTAGEWLRGAAAAHEVSYDGERILKEVKEWARRFDTEIVLDPAGRQLSGQNFIFLDPRKLVALRVVPGEGLRLRLVAQLYQNDAWRVVNAVNDWLHQWVGHGLPKPPERIVWMPTPGWIHTGEDCQCIPLWESTAKEKARVFQKICEDVLSKTAP